MEHIKRGLSKSQGKIINQLANQSHALWQEPNLDRLLKKFLKIIKEDYNIKCLSYFHLSKKASELSYKSMDSELKGIKPLGPAIRNQMFDHLRGVNLTSSQEKTGLKELSYGAKILRFFLIGEPKNQWGLIAWEHEDNNNHSQVEFTILDFLIRQLQNSTKWFGKLEKTQALLHLDDLTGLYNYRYLDICLDAEIRRAQRFQTSFCLLFIDLDDFKPVNDIHGHLAGSQVLKQVANVLKEGLREVDTIFRYGGDEYVVLLLETNRSTGAMAAERIRRQIESFDFVVSKHKTVKLTASIGVAACPENGINKEKLLNLADFCMYKGKREGKNAVIVMAPEETEIPESPAPQIRR